MFWNFSGSWLLCKANNTGRATFSTKEMMASRREALGQGSALAMSLTSLTTLMKPHQCPPQPVTRDPAEGDFSQR